jgi:nucleoside-diphosphate-sugar epimerase
VKILITGGDGYIAKSLYTTLFTKHNITVVNRNIVDLSGPFETLKYFSNKYFDIVIHCAVSGGSRLRPDTWDDLDNNLKMYYNLLRCSNRFRKLIHFGSGAEIFSPETPYGLSKKIIANSILEKENFYNIKIFAVFDKNELPTRFIKANIKRYMNQEPMIIHQDKFMDFFYMEDLISLVNYYINNDNPPKQIDCSYKDQYKLSDIASIINNLSTNKVDIQIENPILGREYKGNFVDLGIPLKGLKYGITQSYNYEY